MTELERDPKSPAGGELGERLKADYVEDYPARIAVLEGDLKILMQVNEALARRWKRATALNEEAKTVLEPFAKHAEIWFEMGDTRPVTISHGHTLFVRDVRAAAALLKKMGGDE